MNCELVVHMAGGGVIESYIHKFPGKSLFFLGESLWATHRGGLHGSLDKVADLGLH